MSPASHDHEFLRGVRAGCGLCGLQDACVLVAVSGGPDSTALLRGLLAVQEELALDVFAAHLDHGMRPESAADAEWVRELCASLNVPLVAERSEPRSGGGESVEEQARNRRYAFLKRTAVANGCPFVAVGHTSDDQAETVLHHVLRGTGLAGLAGIPRVRELADGVTVVRPLLDVSRGTVLAYLEELGQGWRCDATNVEADFTRNRIRASLLPLLEREYNPQVQAALLRLAAQARDAQAALEDVATAMLDRALLERAAEHCRLDTSQLADQPRHLLRECFVQLWKRQGWPRQGMGFGDWERAVETALCGGAVTLPGRVEVRRRGGLLVVRRAGGDAIPEDE